VIFVTKEIIFNIVASSLVDENSKTSPSPAISPAKKKKKRFNEPSDPDFSPPEGKNVNY
jgi:hypothetical protein